MCQLSGRIELFAVDNHSFHALLCICDDFTFCFLEQRTNSLSPSPPLSSPLSPPHPPLTPLPSSLPLSLISPSPLLFSLPLKVGPLNTARGPGELTALPQWGLAPSPSRQTIWCIFELKSAALVTAVFVDFPKNKCK